MAKKGPVAVAGDCAARLEYEPLVEEQGAGAGLPISGSARSCAAWLLETLSSVEGPMTPKEVVAMVAEAGYPRWMVFKARGAGQPDSGHAHQAQPQEPLDWRNSWQFDSLKSRGGRVWDECCEPGQWLQE